MGGLQLVWSKTRQIELVTLNTIVNVHTILSGHEDKVITLATWRPNHST